MLRFERIRRFACLTSLIPKWTNREDLENFLILLKESESEGDIVYRVNTEKFNQVYAIELIRHYLGLESVENIDHEWLTQDERENSETNACTIYKQRLDSEEWGNI